MNAKQRRKAERFSIKFVMKMGGLFKEHVNDWRNDPTVTKEHILDELDVIVRESGLLK